MKKPENIKKPDVWDMDTAAADVDETAGTIGAEIETKPTKKQLSAQDLKKAEPLYDLEGLMTDFPTAKELEKFLFDKTAISLDLKGRSNKFKYQTALDILNGGEIPQELVNAENPYLDKNDLVPVDPMKTIPPRPREIHGTAMVTQFLTRTFPHPDDDWKSSGQKCDVVFRKYTNNVITYEVLGPVAPRAVGERVNKFGKTVPERYTWVDPRTGEQVIRTESGMLTPLGTRLKMYMQRQKVNKTTVWDAWVDREFVLMDGQDSIGNDPWGTQ